MSEDGKRCISPLQKAGVHPRPDDFVLALGETISVPSGQRVIVTFTTNRNRKQHIKKVFADRYADMTYKWVVGGFTLNTSEFEFESAINVGKLAADGSQLVLVMENTSSTDKDVDISISGWERGV